MKALILVLSVVSLVACGKSNEKSSGVVETFNYDCVQNETLEEGFALYTCEEKTKRTSCEVLTSNIEYFNDTDCENFSFDLFKEHLKQKGITDPYLTN